MSTMYWKVCVSSSPKPPLGDRGLFKSRVSLDKSRTFLSNLNAHISKLSTLQQPVISQVLLSAGITTKSGKCLMSRQFVDMSRTRIEGLFAAFPKIMGGHEGKGSSSGGSGGGQVQHTFVETDSVRWVTIEYVLAKKEKEKRVPELGWRELKRFPNCSPLHIDLFFFQYCR